MLLVFLLPTELLNRFSKSLLHYYSFLPSKGYRKRVQLLQLVGGSRSGFSAFEYNLLAGVGGVASYVPTIIKRGTILYYFPPNASKCSNNITNNIK